jgi:hypothetical protein
MDNTRQALSFLDKCDYKYDDFLSRPLDPQKHLMTNLFEYAFRPENSARLNEKSSRKIIKRILAAKLKDNVKEGKTVDELTKQVLETCQDKNTRMLLEEVLNTTCCADVLDKLKNDKSNSFSLKAMFNLLRQEAGIKLKLQKDGIVDIKWNVDFRNDPFKNFGDAILKRFLNSDIKFRIHFNVNVSKPAQIPNVENIATNFSTFIKEFGIYVDSLNVCKPEGRTIIYNLELMDIVKYFPNVSNLCIEDECSRVESLLDLAELKNLDTLSLYYKQVELEIDFEKFKSCIKNLSLHFKTITSILGLNEFFFLSELKIQSTTQEHRPDIILDQVTEALLRISESSHSNPILSCVGCKGWFHQYKLVHLICRMPTDRSFIHRSILNTFPSYPLDIYKVAKNIKEPSKDLLSDVIAHIRRYWKLEISIKEDKTITFVIPNDPKKTEYTKEILEFLEAGQFKYNISFAPAPVDKVKNPVISDEHLKFLRQYGKNVTDLNLFPFELATEECIASIVTLCPNLVVLEVCGNVTNKTLSLLPTSLSQLGLHQCPQLVNLHELRHLINLTYLGIFECSNMNDITVISQLTRLVNFIISKPTKISLSSRTAITNFIVKLIQHNLSKALSNYIDCEPYVDMYSVAQAIEKCHPLDFLKNFELIFKHFHPFPHIFLTFLRNLNKEDILKTDDLILRIIKIFTSTDPSPNYEEYFTRNFPPNFKEYLTLYPNLYKNHEGTLYIVTHKGSIQDSPYDMLHRVYKMGAFKDVKIKLYGQRGVDGGAIARQSFFFGLFVGLFKTKRPGITFEEQPNGKKLLCINPVVITKEDLLLIRSIGTIFACTIESKGKFFLSELFHESMFESLLRFTDDDLFADLTFSRMIELYEPLVDKTLIKDKKNPVSTDKKNDTFLIFESVKRIMSRKVEKGSSPEEQEVLNQKLLTENKKDIDYLKRMGLIDEDEVKCFIKIQGAIHENYMDVMLPKIIALQTIAKGLSDCLPIKWTPQNVEEFIEMREYAELAFMTPEGFYFSVQGKLTKEFLKQMIVITGDNEVLNERLRQLTINWIDEELSEEGNSLKNFVTGLTGVPALTTQVQFEFDPKCEGVVPKACTAWVFINPGYVQTKEENPDNPLTPEMLIALYQEWANAIGIDTYTTQ